MIRRNNVFIFFLFQGLKNLYKSILYLKSLKYQCNKLIKEVISKFNNAINLFQLRD